MRLLGAFAPNTEEGTIVGQTTAAPAVTAEFFKNCRRVNIIAFSLLLLFVVSSFLLYEKSLFTNQEI
jgi:hypothetical protein